MDSPTEQLAVVIQSVVLTAASQPTTAFAVADEALHAATQVCTVPAVLHVQFVPASTPSGTAGGLTHLGAAHDRITAATQHSRRAVSTLSR